MLHSKSFDRIICASFPDQEQLISSEWVIWDLVSLPRISSSPAMKSFDSRYRRLIFHSLYQLLASNDTHIHTSYGT